MKRCLRYHITIIKTLTQDIVSLSGSMYTRSMVDEEVFEISHGYNKDFDSG